MAKRDGAVSLAKLKGHVVETGQTVEIVAPRKRKRKKGWRDHVGLADLGLLSKLEISGLEWRVLMAVMASVPEKGGADAFCTVKEIADQLGVHSSSAARAMSALAERQVLWSVRGGKWHVSTWLMFNGDFESWNDESERDPEPVWVRADPATGEVK